ncbi:hypothetical protein DVA86_18280 [Streptomyces armeniacus]|nr:hypothetical protein DVA86_18280 [Streptomyces armeniacus]
MNTPPHVPQAEHGAAEIPDPSEMYDVAILGSHLETGLLAAALARQGVRVLLAGASEDSSAPAGETTVPYTAEVFNLLARRFDVPEAAAFGLFPHLPDRIRAGSGLNKSLGYLYHRPGKPQHPDECVQFVVPGEHGEWHPYRPDVDRYARELARKYGALTTPDTTEVEDAWTEDDHTARVRVTGGTTYRARFLVDAVGAGSPLARRNGGDDMTPRLKHTSRVYAAVMRDVTPFEELVAMRRYRHMAPWSQGTVNHLFDGGWLQLAAFGNHEESGNPLTSVTLSLAPDAFPDLPDDPDKVFAEVIRNYPDIERQFQDATPVRPWTAAGQWQRTAGRTYGTGWFLLGRSAVRNDMFLARDITMGMESVCALAAALVAAVREDDFSPERFARIAEFQQELSRWNDALLHAARTACTDFRLWNAYCRIWLVWQQIAHLALRRARAEGEASEGRDWSAVEKYELGGMWFDAPSGLRDIISDSLRIIDSVRTGRVTPATAADQIFGKLREAPFIPPLKILKSARTRVYLYSWPQRIRMLFWLKFQASDDFRRLLTRENVMTTKPPAADGEE